MFSISPPPPFRHLSSFIISAAFPEFRFTRFDYTRATLARALLLMPLFGMLKGRQAPFRHDSRAKRQPLNAIIASLRCQLFSLRQRR
jgi:hypothetical protein